MLQIEDQLTVSISKNKGVYALLLGAGVSRSAGIPSAWGIMESLISQLANLRGVTVEHSVFDWYHDKFGTDPSYSQLLSDLAPTSTERMSLLRGFFEPELDDDSGIKKPTPAHKAIARLVKDGYIKLIVTTNFDRLMEDALRELGIVPQIISHAGDIKRAVPLVHAPITIVKLNGDYTDCEFKNTIDELNNYSSEIKQYLKGCFRDFAFITCGWSGEYDTELVNIMNSAYPRYHTYFTYINEADIALSKLLTPEHSAYRHSLQIKNADEFFLTLADKVEAYDRSNQYRMTKDMAISRVRKYIARDEYLIQFDELQEQLTDQVLAGMKECDYTSMDIDNITNQDVMHHYQDLLRIFLPCMMEAVKWAKPQHENIIAHQIQRIVNQYSYVLTDSHYPISWFYNDMIVLVLLYALGFSCFNHMKYGLLHSLYMIERKDNQHRLVHIVLSLHMQSVARETIESKNIDSKDIANISELIQKTIRPFINTDDEDDFECTIGLLEYFYSLYYAMFFNYENIHDFVPCGNYVYSNMRFFQTLKPHRNQFSAFIENIDYNKQNHPIFEDGMFAGKYEFYETVKSKVDQVLPKIVHSMLL